MGHHQQTCAACCTGPARSRRTSTAASGLRHREGILRSAASALAAGSAYLGSPAWDSGSSSGIGGGGTAVPTGARSANCSSPNSSRVCALSLPLQSAIVALAQPPRALHGQPAQPGGIERDVRGLDRAGEHRRGARRRGAGPRRPPSGLRPPPPGRPWGRDSTSTHPGEQALGGSTHHFHRGVQQHEAFHMLVSLADSGEHNPRAGASVR